MLIGVRRAAIDIPVEASSGLVWTTIFSQALDANDRGWTDYSTRNMVQITGGAGANGLIRATFAPDDALQWQTDNLAIGISTMANAGDTINEGATTTTPVEFLFSGANAGAGGHGFLLPAGVQIVSDPLSFGGFTATNILVQITDHHSSLANPRTKTGLGNFPGGCRMAYAAATNSYASASAFGSGIGGQVLGLTKIEVA